MVRIAYRKPLGLKTLGFKTSGLIASGLIVSIAALAISTTPADARRHHRSGKSVSHAKAQRYTPPYSDIVVDANSGKVMHEESADALRHPASLTKIMTLYLLFERLEAGKIRLSTPLTVSAHAASMAPSKLDLKPGDTIRVEDAIKAVVTKSANDVAVVIAENLGGGDESTFCRLMTKKARALGMSRTTYRNASGLPNPEQITSARDQAILGRAIQERFPKYYAYFSTHTFAWKGNSMRNHNHLLGSLEGVDGIKTGYVNASGFNIVTSVRRNGRHLVAVVMGGHSANSRDARMKELIGGNILLASARKTASPIMEAADTSAAPVVVASANDSAPLPRAVAKQQAEESANVASESGAMFQGSDPVDLTPSAGTPSTGSTDELRPIAVKTVRVRAAALPTNAINSAPATQRAEAPQQAAAPASRQTASGSIAVASIAPPAGNTGAVSGGGLPFAVKPAPPASQTVASVQPAVMAPPATSSAQVPSEWMIQVGALETQKDAAERISDARSKAAKILARAKSFTEKIIKKDMTLYRARFALISKEDAEAACKTLKSAKIVCIALRN